MKRLIDAALVGGAALIFVIGAASLLAAAAFVFLSLESAWPI